MNRTFLTTLTLAAALLPAGAQSLQHWTGTATVNNQPIPVRLDLTTPTKDGAITGTLINGKETSVSSSGKLDGTHLTLNFNYYAKKIEGKLSGDTFTGTFLGPTGNTLATIELHPNNASRPSLKPISATVVPSITGDWEIAVKSPKGEFAWTLRVKPTETPGQIHAVILRIDGDTGSLYGSWDSAHNEYRVGHVSAAGVAIYSLKPQPDHTLLVADLKENSPQWSARRPSEARKENLAPPTKSTEQTGVIDPSKPLHYSGVTLDGKTITSSDPRFKGKVVIVAIGGSWCPNCHDEAPFLVELYNRYHAQGLEIVNLSFEESEQLKDPQRLRAFVARYHIPYTVLLAGTRDQLAEKLPQGKNLNCWPTSFFIGRDGLVKETHAGFSGPATGQAYISLKSETGNLLQTLLAQKPSSHPLPNEVAQR